MRPVIAQLVEAGAEGKQTTAEDEARFEKAREDQIREEPRSRECERASSEEPNRGKRWAGPFSFW